MNRATKFAEKVFGKPSNEPANIAKAEETRKALGCGCLVIVAIFATILGLIGNCNFMN